MDNHTKLLRIKIGGLDNLYIREWINDDIEILPIIASNRKIWLYLRDFFPHPYTRSDAAKWVRSCKKQDKKTWFAISEGDKLIGSIGIYPLDDIFKRSCEIGYWLSETYWGRGIMTEAIKTLTEYIFKNFKQINRIFGGVFDCNIGSQRALEKAGYKLEGRLRQHITKVGKTYDELIYAKLRNE